MDRETLIEDYGSALDAEGLSALEIDGHLGNADLLMDWHDENVSGALSELDEQQLATYVLLVYPRTFLGEPDPPTDVCQKVGRFVEFLGATDRLTGGVERATELRRLVDTLDSAAAAESADPSNHGEILAYLTHPSLNPPGQPSYFELVSRGQLTDDEIEAELGRRLAAFQELPAEERAAAEEAVADAHASAFGIPSGESMELPFLHIEPSPDAVEASAAQAAIFGKIEALRAGADVDELVAEVAKDIGAVSDEDDRLVPDDTWEPPAPVDYATEIYHLLAEFGVLSYNRPDDASAQSDLIDILDSGVIHWLAIVLAPDAAFTVEDIVESNIEVAYADLGSRWHPDFEDVVRDGINRIVEVYTDAGILTTDDDDLLRLTPFGAHIVALDVTGVGYTLRRADGLADASAETFVDTLNVANDDQRAQVAAAWQPARTAAEKVSALTELLTADEDPAARMKTLSALDLFDGATVKPDMNKLLDGPAAGYAALYLMSRDLADGADLSEHVTMALFVDVLAGSLDDPESLCDMFSQAPTEEDPYAALEQMWREPSPETELVLDALGRHLPDKKLAKAARKALVRHRSWMANRG